MRQFTEFNFVQDVYDSIFDGDYEWAEELSINETTLSWTELWEKQHKYKWHEVVKNNGLRDEQGNSLELTDKRVADDEYNLPKMIALFNDINKHHENGDEDKAKEVWLRAFKKVSKSGKISNAWRKNIVLKDDSRISFGIVSKTQSKGEGVVEVKMSPAERTARQESLGAIAIMFANAVDFKKSGGVPIQDSDIINKVNPLHRIGSWQKSDGSYDVDEFNKKFIKPIGKTPGDIEEMTGRSIEKLMEFVVEFPEWLVVTLKTIKTTYNSLLKKGNKNGVSDDKKFEVHRGSPLMDSIYAAYKKTAEVSGIDPAIIKNDKWNPGDVWMIEEKQRENIQKLLNDIIDNEKNSPRTLWTKIKNDAVNKIGIEDRPEGKDFKNVLHLYNWLIEQLFDKDLLKGVSLKKIGAEGAVTNYNEDSKRDEANIIVRLDDERPFFIKSGNDPLATKDVYLNFNVTEGDKEHSYEMQIRTFDKKFQAVQGEIKGAFANHGKVGLGVMKFLFGLGTGKKSPGKFYKTWRRLLSILIKRGTRRIKGIPQDTEFADLASRSGGIVEVGSLWKDETTRDKITTKLLANVFMLHQFVLYDKETMPEGAWDRFYRKHKNTSIYTIVSKLQALEICAWLKFRKSKRDILMKRLYFYASSRGVKEAGAFSSKFLKIS